MSCYIENTVANNQSTEDSTCLTSNQSLTDGANGCGNFPPDPMGTVQIREQPPVPSNSSSEFCTSASSNFGLFSTSPIFNFAPPPAEFPLQLKILHILMAHVGSGENKEKITCRLQSPSAVARGQLGFVVEHELCPFNRTDKIFTEHRFRDLERRSQASVSEFGSKFIEHAPPPPMNTLTLFCLASDRLQLDPQMTIEVARKLNKIGLISSPLTNGNKYSAGFPRKEMIASIVLHLDELCNIRLNAQEVTSNFVRPIHRLGSAEPIHPLLVDHRETKYRKALDEDQLARQLYELICRYFLATCLCPSKIAEMTIKFSIGPETFKSVKHTVVVQGFLLVVPWMRPEFCDTELPTEATKQQNQFIKQTFIVSDVRRLQIENPKGGLSEAKLISQMALLELGNYDTIPETLSKLMQKKLANVVGPGRWIVPTSEGLQRLESFRQDGVDTDGNTEQVSDDVLEERDEDDGSDVREVKQHSDRRARKRVRFDLTVPTSALLRSRSMGPMRSLDFNTDRSPPIRRHRRAPSPEISRKNFNDFSPTDRSHHPTLRTSFSRHSMQEIGKQQQRFNNVRTFPYENKSNAVFVNAGKENHQRSSRFSFNRPFEDVVRNEFGETKIFLGNLSPRIDSNNLFDIFRKFGTIRKMDVLQTKRIAFIEFARNGEAENAISKMDGRTIDGFVLTVQKYRPKCSTEFPENRPNLSQSFYSSNKFAYNPPLGLSENQMSTPSPEAFPSAILHSADRFSVFDERSNAPNFPNHCGYSAPSYPSRRHNSSFDDRSSPPKKTRLDGRSSNSSFCSAPSFGSPPMSSAIFSASPYGHGFRRAVFRGSQHSHHQQECLFVPPSRSPSVQHQFSSPRHSLPLFSNDGYFFRR